MVTAPRAKSSECSEYDALYLERHEGKVDLVEVLVEQDGHLEHGARDAESGETQTCVPLQAEQRAQPFLAAEGRGQLDEEVRGLAADVPEAVRRARRNGDCVAGTERYLLSPEPEPERSRDALEPLQLMGVDVHGHVSAGSDEQIAGDALTRAPPKDDPLPGDRFLDRVLRSARRGVATRHATASSSACAAPSSIAAATTSKAAAQARSYAGFQCSPAIAAMDAISAAPTTA